jgi:hypothetical protein
LILANAHSFDTKVQPLSVSTSYAERLTELARPTIIDWGGGEEGHQTLLHLPTRLAGFVAPNPQQAAALARLASAMEAGPSLRAAIVALGASNAAAVDLGGAAPAQQFSQSLHQS